jgi:hemoglobin-like flavoprotein
MTTNMQFDLLDLITILSFLAGIVTVWVTLSNKVSKLESKMEQRGIDILRLNTKLTELITDSNREKIHQTKALMNLEIMQTRTHTLLEQNIDTLTRIANKHEIRLDKVDEKIEKLKL